MNPTPSVTIHSKNQPTSLSDNRNSSVLCPFIIFQLGSVFVLGQPFGVGAVIAVALIALIVWLMARKGYDPSKKKETLSAVEANS